MDKYVPNGFFSAENPCIPTGYSDGFSYAEEVGKLIVYVNGLYEEYVTLNGNDIELTNSYNTLITQLTEYKTQLDNFIKGYTIADGTIQLKQMSNDIMNIFHDWINNYIYTKACFVSFGLEDGHFVTYIPANWTDIVFQTDVDGHLILNF
jgi:hypothetical protein